MRNLLLLLLCGGLLGACATQSDKELDALSAGGVFNGGRAADSELPRLIAAAAKYPLGSRENPVRVNMPMGQRAYLDRLRCSDGAPPQYDRVGNFGAGVFGSIIDGYRVVCASAEPRESMIYMDMYHPQHDEKAPPPNFTLAQ